MSQSFGAQGYNAKRLDSRGYLILAFFGPGFQISLQASGGPAAIFSITICLLFDHVLGAGHTNLCQHGLLFDHALEQDMQLVMDICPLRVDAVFVREFREDDLKGPSSTCVPNGNKAVSTPSTGLNSQIKSVLCISVLDINQPVQITEAEVVRVKKRSRGLLIPSVFGAKG